MRSVIILLFIVSIVMPCAGQQAPQKEVKKNLPNEVPTKTEMPAQMKQVVNELNNQIVDLEKQIAEAKKNKEDEATIKDLEDQVVMLKKQVEMMSGLNKGLSGIAEKTFEKAGEEEAIVPKKDIARISMLPKKILTEAELVLHIKNIQGQIERMIPATERAEALNIYNETKKKYNSSTITGNAASSCWMLGHSEKAVYIMGKACLDDLDNTDNLSNYAAFLTMSGAEQAALPILEYLNQLFPDNSTILNNIGQAWFGLGDMDKAKEYLDDAVRLYTNHSTANATLSDIYLSQGNTSNAIAFLKASLKETYDPDKEAQLTSLGYTIMFADLPPLNYPLEDDPFGFIPLMKTLPQNIQTDVNNKAPAIAIQRFLNGVIKASSHLKDKQKILEEKSRERDKKISTDSRYRNKIIEPHNSPGYKLAARSVQLRIIETQPVPVTGSLDNFPIEKIIENCQKFWLDSVLEPLRVLQLSVPHAGTDCNNADAITNAYLQKKQEIYSNGVNKVKTMFVRNSNRLREWIKYNLYGTIDDPPRDENDFAYAMIGEMETTKGKTILKNKETLNLLGYLSGAAGRFSTIIKSQCPDRQTPDPDPGEDELIPLIKTRVECQFRKKITPSDHYFFDLVCNTIVEKDDPRLPKRKPNNKKGSAQNSTRRSQTSGRSPLGAGGPSSFFEEEVTESYKKLSPLNAEDKDPSQFSLEYDRWGSLIGFNLQLNKEGNTLADPDSKESGIDSRWSWNAAGSAKKGFLNKLLIK